MHALRTAITITWALFWVYWLLAAVGAKHGRGAGRRIPLGGVTLISVILLVRVFRGAGTEIQSPIIGAIGAILFACGLALAVWARLHLGRNWGMPMTQKQEPELVTSGPYRFVRHPIYSGLLLGLLGTALATNVLGVIVMVVAGAYFYYAASVEERNLSTTFPTAYPAYRASTKMLIPFVL